MAAPLTGFLSTPKDGAEEPAANDLPFMVKLESAKRGQATAYVPNEVLVKFIQGAEEEKIKGLKLGHGAEEASVSPFSGVRRWRMPASMSVEGWVQVLERNPLVEYAEPNYVAYSSFIPNDPGFGFQWHLDNDVYGGIHAKGAWDMVKGDQRVIVAVIDTGVAYEENVAPSYWHIDTYQAYSGHSWWCGVSSAPYSWTALYGNTAAPGYGNGWREYLQHSFDLTSATGTVTFSYQYRCDLESGYDFAFVEVSANSGQSWIQLKNYTGKGGGSVRWRQDSLDLSSYKGKQVLMRFRVFSDESFSDEDYYYWQSRVPPRGFASDGAFFVDQIMLAHGGGTLFSDDVESGSGAWVTTSYEQAPDLAGTSFWRNTDEIAGNLVDDDGNGYADDVNGWDFANQDAHPNDDNAHGTHVTGTIAQTTNNGYGVAGVAFGATIMPVKVLSAGGSGTYDWIAEGIYYAVNNGADVISMSLGGSSGSATLQNAVAYAHNNGVVVIAASGNDGGAVSYPAAYDAYVIAVGATQYNEVRASYSNYGASLDVVAPGGNTGVDLNGDDYADGVLQNTFGDTPVDWGYWFYQGTSMATPHVSGLAALLLARNPSLTPDEVQNVLQSTAEDLGTAGWDSQFGWGLIDAEAALLSLAEPVHLSLTVDPPQTSYTSGQSLTLTVTVFNEMNPALNSTLTLTVTGTGSYSHYEFQPIAVAADEVKPFTFSWTVPDAHGTYVVEVGLVPTQLTAYDTLWLDVS